jgi:hypothetical protein
MTLRVLAVDVTGAEVSTGPSTPAGAPSQPAPGGDEVCDCYRTQVPCHRAHGRTPRTVRSESRSSAAPMRASGVNKSHTVDPATCPCHRASMVICCWSFLVADQRRRITGGEDDA